MQKRSTSPSELQARVKCVLVGDGSVGKTSLIVSYTTNGFPVEYLPTAYDNYSVQVMANDEPVQLQLCDTAGQDDFDLLRPMCYPLTDVFLLCFSVVCPTSFYNIREKWLPEIWSNCPSTPVILVGLQMDLRNDVKVLLDLGNYGERPVRETEGRSKASEIGAVAYMECSALTQKNVKEVFDLAITTALDHRHRSSSDVEFDRSTESSSKRSSRKAMIVSKEKPKLRNELKASRNQRWKRSLCCFVCR